MLATSPPLLHVADLSMLETAELKPEGAPIVSGELKNNTYIHTYIQVRISGIYPFALADLSKPVDVGGV